MDIKKFDIIKNAFKSRGRKYFFSLAGLILFYSLLFEYLYSNLEHKEIDFFRAFEFIIESMTTTGYGGLLPFYHPVMNIFAIILQVSGVLIIFMTIPIFFVPWLQRKMSTEPPHKTSEDIKDHVIICRYSEAVNFLIEELEINGIPYIVIEKDRETCFNLLEQGIRSIQGDPNSSQGLKNAGISSARCILAMSKDEENASIILTARQLCDLPIIATVENPENSRYLEYAGAAKVACPKHELGARMAYKTAFPVALDLSKALHIPANLHITEILVHKDSSIARKSLSEAAIGNVSGAKIIGIWANGKFATELHSDTMIEPSSILLAIGTEKEIEELRHLSLPAQGYSDNKSGNVIIVGFGNVGQEIYKYLSHIPDNVAIVDRQEFEIGNLFVGNASDDGILKKAGIENASVVLICLNDDANSLYTTLVARNLNPDAYIITRCNILTNIDKFYKAGANYVVALPMISGIMFASLVTGKGKLEFEKLNVARFVVKSPKLAGHALRDTGIREKTRCTIIGIEHSGTILLDLTPDLELCYTDVLVTVGTERALRRFYEEFDTAPLP